MSTKQFDQCFPGDGGLGLIEVGDGDAGRNRCTKTIKHLFGSMFVGVHQNPFVNAAI